MLARALNLADDIEVIGQVDSLPTLTQIVKEQRPDWLLLASGDTKVAPPVLTSLIEEHPRLGIVVLSQSWQKWQVKYPGTQPEADPFHELSASMFSFNNLVEILQLQHSPSRV